MFLKECRNYAASGVSQTPNVDGKRKEIAGKTEDDVYESLYEHYSTLEMRPKSLSDVFELLKDRKQNELAGVKKQLGKMFGYLIILAKP